MDGCYESALYQFGYWAAGPDCHEMRIFGLFLPFDRLDVQLSGERLINESLAAMKNYGVVDV